MNFPSDLETVARLDWAEIVDDVGGVTLEASYPNGLGYMRIAGNFLYFYEGGRLVKTVACGVYLR